MDISNIKKNNQRMHPENKDVPNAHLDMVKTKFKITSISEYKCM